MSRSPGPISPAVGGRRAAAHVRQFDAQPLVAAVAAGLLATTWLVPAEGALEGTTGWRAMCWLLLAAIWPLRSPQRQSIPAAPSPSLFLWRGMDLAVGLIVGGQVVGGLLVLLTDGQKRFAANLLLEWLGLGCAWWVLRGLLGSTRWRSHFTLVLMAVALSAAVLGIWQHYVALPQMAAEYAPKLARYRQALASGQTNSLARELAAAGIPTAEPGLTLFEKRLLDSREPFGMFALANTYGGLLAATLVWLAGAFVLGTPAGLCTKNVGSAVRTTAHGSGPHSGPSVLIRGPFLAQSPPADQTLTKQWSGGRRVIGGASLSALTWCVVLTKSRTAALGLLAGLAVLGLCGLARKRTTLSAQAWRNLWIGAAGGVGLVIAAPLGLIAAGVWDAEVLQEAPKSLLYRWQYWVGGGRLIVENPFLGIGLGQFRSAYLRVKLPEASEEIADPHNLWVDAWVNGGLMSVAGLAVGTVWLAVLAWQTLGRMEAEVALPQIPSTGAKPTNTGDRWSVVLGAGGAFVGVFALGLFDGVWDDRLLAMACVWTGVVAWYWREAVLAECLSSRGAALGGALTLLVHLHGAGGFEMPGVMTWCGWLVLLTRPVVLSRPIVLTNELSLRIGRWKWAAAGAGLATAAGCWLWLPDVRCDEQLDRAQQQMIRGRFEQAQSSLDEAATADPWNPEPWRQLAELQFGQIAFVHDSDRSVLFDSALSALREAQRRDPASPHLLQREGDYLLARFQQDSSEKSALQAAGAYRRAVERSPTNAQMLAQWAQAAQSAGAVTVALKAADEALWQDDLNHTWGHVERWLPAAEREKLERLVQTGSTSQVPATP